MITATHKKALLIASGTRHQFAHGFDWRSLLLENRPNLLGNRHLNAMKLRKAESCRSSPDAFRDLSMETGKDFFQFATFAKLDANRAVP
jgi:hypothetical protein